MIYKEINEPILDNTTNSPLPLKTEGMSKGRCIKRQCYLYYIQYQRSIIRYLCNTFTRDHKMRSHFRTSDIPQISIFITFSSHITSPNFEFNVIIWHYGRLSDTFEIKTLCLALSLELLDWPDNITFIILPKSYFTRYFVSSWITLHKSLTLQKKQAVDQNSFSFREESIASF